MGGRNTDIGVVRDRGQVTIPIELRDATSWLKTGAPILFERFKDKIVITPYRGAEGKKKKPTGRSYSAWA